MPICPSGTSDAQITQTTGNLQIAEFHTRHHAVFIISDLTAQENLMISQIIITSVRQHIEKFEV